MKKAGIKALLIVFLSIMTINTVSAQENHRRDRDTRIILTDRQHRDRHDNFRRDRDHNFHRENTYYGYRKSRHERMRHDRNRY